MAAIDWKNAPSFIETQFPVSKLSKESYKERKSNYSQTLTGLGKWWGRKPLILVRATIMGLLLPGTRNPKRDREVFLALLTMDDAGLSSRRAKQIPADEIFKALKPAERERWFGLDVNPERPRLRRGMTADERARLQQTVFDRLTYDAKLEYCERPEHVQGPSVDRWRFINDHLGTTATSPSELVGQLGKLRYGHIPRVGDAFCGGGSIPYEAARIGCSAYGSDLNPVAALLTWAGLNIVGGGATVTANVNSAQDRVFRAVDKQILEWGIERNQSGWRAEAFLYCVEVNCPECGWRVPLAPSWLIGEKSMTRAVLRPDATNERFEIDIESGASLALLAAAKKQHATFKESKLICANPACGQSTPMSVIRGDGRGPGGGSLLRQWGTHDFVPASADIFHERLYCIRWVESWIDDDGIPRSRKHYKSVTPEDEAREAACLRLLTERFDDWVQAGYLPGWRIDPGLKTDEPTRTRGWTHWHQLGTPRQNLTHGLLAKFTDELVTDQREKVACLLGVARCIDWNCRLTFWDSSAANEKVSHVFHNQALNTQVTFGCRGLTALENAWTVRLPEGESTRVTGKSTVLPVPAGAVTEVCDLWITDPPYADAIVYHELSEFFLCWYSASLAKAFPAWYATSRRAFAVTGESDSFRRNMVEAYRRLAERMPDAGMQVVMFTHQDAAVWADLTLILWAAGLAVSAAWCVVTETDAAHKDGNYVQGTVLLVLRKQSSDETAFLDEVHPQVEDEVRSQLASMLSLEDKDDPNFGDSDYQLAAYAAALRVLTRYRGIEDINVEDQLTRVRQAGERNPVEELIADAVRTACDFLIPKGFSSDFWKLLSPEERLYLKAVEVETHGEHRSGVYTELARGFRVKEYKGLLETDKANHTRLKTASGFGTRDLGTAGFGGSTVRALLFAVRETVRTSDPQTGKGYLRDGLPDYWQKRVLVIAVLDYLSNLALTLPHWTADAEGARLLAGALRNDSV